MGLRENFAKVCPRFIVGEDNSQQIRVLVADDGFFNAGSINENLLQVQKY